MFHGSGASGFVMFCRPFRPHSGIRYQSWLSFTPNQRRARPVASRERQRRLYFCACRSCVNLGSTESISRASHAGSGVCNLQTRAVPPVLGTEK